AWGNNNGAIFRSPHFADSLKVQLLPADVVSNLPGLRAFWVRDTSWVAAWADPNALAPPAGVRLPVALDVPSPGGGRIVLFSFPLRAGNQFFTAPRVLSKVLQEFGVSGP
ncbi:MAG: hypothetical protein HYR73_02655, partial [Candidatus Eisenbacteria bacterium]|nr:hypothetical protein [Candidatus Eisenbacteria bacterium]